MLGARPLTPDPRPLLRRLFSPTLPTLVFLLAFLKVLSTGPHWLFGDGDLGWHLQTGKLILQNGAVPRFDTYSWTVPGAPWVAFEWLSDVVFWRVLEAGGFLALLALEAALIAGTFALLCHTILAAGGELFVSLAITGWAFWLSSIHWFARPHLFTWLLMALWCALLHRRLRGPTRAVWAIPLTAPLWVNLHGGWPTGCIVLALFAFGELAGGPGRLTRRGVLGWVLLGVVTFAATFAGPYGWGIHRDILGTLSAKPVLDLTEEWKSPDFRGNARPFRAFFVFALATMPFLPRPARAAGWACLLAGTWLMMESVRHIPLFLLWMAPFAAMGATGALQRLAGASGRAGTALAQVLDAEGPLRAKFQGAGGLLWPVLAVGLAVAGSFPPVLASAPAGFPPERFPAEAVSALARAKPEGRLLNDYSWGGYLAWALPGTPVFIDGRNVLYGSKLSADWLTMATLAPGWRERLVEHRIDWTLFPSGSPLTRALLERGWQTFHADAVATVLVRPGALSPRQGTSDTPSNQSVKP